MTGADVNARNVRHIDSPVSGCTMRVLELVQAEFRAGRRHFHIAVPAPLWKRHIAAALVRLFRQKTLLFAEYPVGLVPWRDDALAAHGDMQEAAGDVWGGQTAHVLSLLPYSCAPITAIAFHGDDPVLALDDGQGQQKAERLHRHFLKHGYRLLLFDECTERHESWRRFLDAYVPAVDAVCVHLSALPTAAPEAAGPDALTCVLPAPSFVRDGHLLPYRIVADAGDAPLLERIPAVLAAEHAALGEHCCALVLIDAPGSRPGRPDPALAGATALLDAISAEPGCEALRPLLVTDASIICHDELVIPILSEVQKIVNIRMLDVRLATSPLGACTELAGEGNDWDPAMFRTVVAELCTRGLTRCLVGAPSLFAAGWESLPLNTIIDASSRPQAAPFVQQLPPQTIADGIPWHAVHFWMLAPGGGITAPGGVIRARLAGLPGVADDGTIEYGAGQLHPLLGDGGDGGDGGDAGDELAAALAGHARAALQSRNRLAQSWKVGQSSRGRLLHGVECRVGGALPAAGYPEALQRSALQAEWEAFRERRRASRLHRVLWGVGACGAALSVLLLFETATALPAAAAVAATYLVYAGLAWLRGRRSAPTRVRLDDEQLLALAASVVAEAIHRLRGDAGQAQHAGQTQHAGQAQHAGPALRRRSDGWCRIVPAAGEADDGAAFAGALEEFLAPREAAYVAHTRALDIGGAPFAARRGEPGAEALRPAVRYGVPRAFAADAQTLSIFIDVLRATLGSCEITRNGGEDAAVAAGAAPQPEFSVHRCTVWE